MDQQEKTDAQKLGDLLSSFSAGCDHCDNRDLWLLARTHNDGGKTRERLRSEGIKHLADVLDDADFAAVEELVKPLVSSRRNPVNLAKVLPNITVPTDVRVYKADESQVYGLKAKYLMFTEEQPPAAVSVQSQLKLGLYSTAAATKSSSSSTAAGPDYDPSDGGEYQYQHKRARRQSATKRDDEFDFLDEGENEEMFMDRMEAAQGGPWKKEGAGLQQQDRKSGQFLPMNESLLQRNTQLCREATGLVVENRQLNKRVDSIRADLATEQKRNRRLTNQLNATELLVAKIKEGSLEAAEAEKRKGSAKLGSSTKEKNKLQRDYDTHVTNAAAEIKRLKETIAQLKTAQTQHAKEATRMGRQVTFAESETEREKTKAAAAVAAAAAAAAKEAAAAEARLAEAEAEVGKEKALRGELEEFFGDYSLLGAARKLLTGDELEEALRVPSLGSIGAGGKGIGEPGSRRKRDLGKVVGMLMSRILQVAYCGDEKDPRKVLEAALGRRDCGESELGMAMAEVAGQEKGKGAVLAAAAASYADCTRSGDDLGALRFLSPVVDLEGVTEAEVCGAFSDYVPLEVGCRVRVAGERNSKHYATLLSTEDSGGCVRISMRRGRGGSIIDGETVGATVSVNDVWHANSVRCTKGQVRKAKLLARRAHPGAEPEARTNPHSGISPERAAYVSDFLRRKDNVKEVDAGLANAKKGVKYALTTRRWRLWQKLKLEMEQRDMKPASWSFFWGLTSSAQYVLLKYDTCCCGICRDLGFDNYDELREILKELDSEIKRHENDDRGLPRFEELLDRVEKEEEFRRGDYLRHLEGGSSCGSHCLRLLLTTHNDPAFRSPCTHDGPALGAGEEPKTMVELVRAAYGRKPKPTDWHHTCESCGAATGRGGQSNVLMCTHCEAVVHPACLATWHNDQPSKGKDGTWTCPVCVRDIDAVKHAPGCSKCDEASYITSDVELGLDLLGRLEAAAPPPSSSRSPSSSSPSSSSSSSSSSSEKKKPSPSSSSSSSFEEVPASVFLRARLARYLDKEAKYHGHLIQDRNQAVFKDTVIQNMGIYSFYLLVDYWAELGIVKPGGAACCEGDSVGISAHGSMFVYKNPTSTEREEISLQHGGIDWSEFPAPPDGGGPAYCEEHAAAYCDDAKQDQFHTKSVMEATVTSSVKARPWLGKRRCSFAQSDNASNYRDPTIEVDCGALGTRCFSVAGMGKDEGDGNGAVNKRQLAAMRDGPDGRSFMCAADYTSASKSLTTSGQNYGELVLDRSSSVQVVGRKSFPRHYHLYTINDDTGLTFWEYLDPTASATSIAAGGGAVGYGVGIKEAMADFDENRRSQAERETGAGLSIGNWSAPRGRSSNVQKRGIEVEQAAKAEAKKTKREAAAAAAQEEAESQYRNDVDVCQICHTRFLSAGGLAKHRSRGCGKRTTVIEKEKRKARRSVLRRLEAMDDLAIEVNKQRIERLAEVTVTLSAPRTTAAAVGIEVEEEEEGGSLVITAVSGLALDSGLVGETFVVESVGGRAPASAGSIPSELAAGESATFVFRRPLPPIPFHGSARETIHKEPRFVMPPEVVEWLKEHAYDHKEGREKMRPYTAWASQDAKFRNCLRKDTKTPVALERNQVGKWLSEQNKAEKNRRRMQRALSGSSSSKKAAKAPKKSATKKRKKGATEEDEDEDEALDYGTSESDDDDDEEEEDEEDESEEGEL